ncbi:SdiA-regulated domain-containing protein [Halarcobacter sp.]|uniref:SdiA-regulated domain-containing protein n=1 Tax=Halarcobacter sp. TaxID=2321133 RepID=UPI002AA8D6AA|nr:SdiA-regulated domain-containing protein [Halarcobacter sp.]
MIKSLIPLFISFFFMQNLFAKEKVIAKIPEASGICYSVISDSLFVVNDEGTLYELSKNGKVLRKKKLGKYDLEAIEVDEKNALLLLINEKKDSILVVEKKSFDIVKKIKIDRKYKGKKVLKKGGNGIEGLALFNNKLYASNQSKKKYPKEDSSIIVILDYDLEAKKLKIKDIIDPKLTDISGLTFNGNILYMISDKNSQIISYNVEKSKVIKKYNLPKKYAQEGITFDKKGNLYIADDNGKILKIKNYLK